MTPPARRRRRPTAVLGAVVWVTVVVAACTSGDRPSGSAVDAGAEGVDRLTVEVLAEHPHDPRAYTQGLLLVDGRLFESTGQYGDSTLREVVPETGEDLRTEELPADYFGEGLARIGDRLVQLTWKEERALVYDLETFELVDEWTYDGQGWGLCHDDGRLVMSDGSNELSFRDPDTFEELGSVEVTADGEAVEQLNELECVDGLVYANVYTTTDIVVIDPETGAVTAVVDASALTPAATRPADVLNGIAHIDGDRFYLTGKNWPTLSEVRIVPAS